MIYYDKRMLKNDVWKISFFSIATDQKHFFQTGK